MFKLPRQLGLCKPGDGDMQILQCPRLERSFRQCAPVDGDEKHPGMEAPAPIEGKPQPDPALEVRGTNYAGLSCEGAGFVRTRAVRTTERVSDQRGSRRGTRDPKVTAADLPRPPEEERPALQDQSELLTLHTMMTDVHVQARVAMYVGISEWAAATACAKGMAAFHRTAPATRARETADWAAALSEEKHEPKELKAGEGDCSR